MCLSYRVEIDRNGEGIESCEEVRVELLSDLDSIKRKLVLIGSHDVAIDIIGDTIPVVSAHVGSMGGIFAMKNDACHIAPIHLLDAETGEYNVPFVKKYFGEGTMAIIKGLGRTQGFMVRRGDDRIKSVGDLKGGRFSFAKYSQRITSAVTPSKRAGVRSVRQMLPSRRR